MSGKIRGRANHRGECRSCGAPVLWAQTLAGAPHPLDPDEDPERGNMRKVGLTIPTGEAATGGVLVVEKIPKSEVGQPSLDGEPRYLTHFATCPDSRHWSKG